MEITSSRHHQERENNPSPATSPYSNGSSSNSSNGSLQVPTPPHTPTPIPRSDSNPYPTTFVQADSTSFKQVVQMLTGSSETTQKAASKSTAPVSDPPKPAGARIPPIKSSVQKKQGFKLYERRNSLKNGLMINTLIPGLPHNSSFSPREPEILSPSILDFRSLVLSPVTPVNEDTVRSKSSPSMGNDASELEEKAIAEKKFYLHPSPRTTPRDSQPQLLPLFPVTSPRVSGSSS